MYYKCTNIKSILYNISLCYQCYHNYKYYEKNIMFKVSIAGGLSRWIDSGIIYAHVLI